MKRHVLAVFDSASQLYGQPMFVPSIGGAVRSFGDECNRRADDNALYMHPEDFELRVLAVFEDETGVFSSPSDGIGFVLARGKDCKSVA
jgi:hypothetical protein